MAIRHDLSALLDKKMDRKDFLKHVGVAVVAVTGVAAIAKTLAQSQQQSLTKTSAATRSSGYGGSAYGGSKTS